MTIKIIGENIHNGVKRLVGLSADTKPTSIDPGSKFYELDGLNRTFTFSGTEWLETETPLANDQNGYGIVLSPEHYRLHNGQAFSATSILSNLAGNGTTYIEFVIPSGKSVTFQGFNLQSDRLIKTEFFESPATVTDGTTEILLTQRYRPITNSALTKIYTNPTSITGGTLLRTLVFGTVDGQGNSVSPLPPSGSDSYGFNLKPNTKYVLKLTNLSSSATTLIYYNLDVYEF